MRQNLLSSQPGGRVLDKELHDEILGLGGDAGPVLVREDQPALLDVGEEKLLTGSAGLAAVPATVRLEGRVAAHQNVGDNSQGPKITFLVVAETVIVQVRVVVRIVVLYEGVDDLRSHVLQAAHWSAEIRRAELLQVGVGGV